MNAPQTLIDQILTLALELPGLPLKADTLEQASARASVIEAQLQAGTTHWFAQKQSAEAIDLATQLAQAAIDIGPASRALRAAAQWARQSEMHVVGINLRIARASLLRALRPLAKVPTVGEWPVAPITADRTPLAPIAAPESQQVDFGVLRNIATYHREHERFHMTDITESAADLYREANKLAIVANVWLNKPVAMHRTDIDFSLPQYQVAGCEDLNALDAIAAIGVLFMEGRNEPPVFPVIKGKLNALAGAWSTIGQWMSDKVDAAWQREQATFGAPELAEVAQARLNTIVTNWRGAREMTLAGQLLKIASASLQSLDVSPKTLRSGARTAAGRSLLEIAWMLSLAAQIRARSAADLAENDRNWTTYLEGLASIA